MMVLGQASVGESVPDLDTASEVPLSTQAIFVSMITLLVFAIIFVAPVHTFYIVLSLSPSPPFSLSFSPSLSLPPSLRMRVLLLILRGPNTTT